MNVVRGGSGLGDSLYVRAVAEHLVREGKEVTVKSNFPGVFAGLRVQIDPFTRQGADVIAHYSSLRALQGTTQWQDICTTARIPKIPFVIPWAVVNRPLVKEVKAEAAGRPIVILNGGRPPMGRKDGYGREMLPKSAAFEQVLARLAGCFIVKVGNDEEVYPLPSNLDLSGKTSPADLLDMAYISRGLVGQCSFMVPLAEGLDKPMLAVWAAAGLRSPTPFIRFCTPVKVLSKPSSVHVMDDWPQDRIEKVADEFADVVRRR